MLKKIRRHFKVYLTKKYFEKHKEKKTGNCKRCGNCCKIWYKCPFLEFKSKEATCKIYKHRPAVCRIFPLNRKDLEEISTKCGFHFEKSL
ncbi:MAG: hypothetical protein A2252_10320 [Elusimicrobia bacterium RIFOXYA2_FULL_39_19]|nr:MAG: hypothetical protein A2252_10320 [Elusimicrobia bacterium RIFOXYA2_FULL_39_19]